MEKRLFLAVFLSLVVVFGFQTMFGSKKQTGNDLTQIVDSKQDTSVYGQKKVATGAPLPVPPSPATPAIDFKEEQKTVQTKSFEAVFTNKGGNLDRLFLKSYAYNVPVSKFLGLDEFDNKPFAFTNVSSKEVMMMFQDRNWRIEKIYSFDGSWNMGAAITIENTSDRPIALKNSVGAIAIDISRMDNNALKSDWTLFEYSAKKENKIVRKNSVNNLNDKWNKEESGKVEWLAFRDRYFAIIVAPDQAFEGYSTKVLGEKSLLLSGKTSSEIVNPGQIITYKFTIFAGPQKLDVLKAAGKNFDKLMVFSDWGWLDAIAKGIYWLLGATHKIIPIWGICIILISILVYGAMYPLTLKSMVSMKKMQVLQPKIAELREKHAKSPEKLNAEIMDLYRRNNANPMSGCLPLLLQMPIFVGLYQVLWRSIYFRGEGFLWIKDLSMPDHLFKLPFTIPFLGEYFNILPILMTVIMFVQQQFTMKSMAGGDPEQVAQQKIMATIMPVFLGFIFYNFASGLNLYFVVFYLLSTASQWHISKDVKAVA
jgi:YidC/Oxa1 family membrane protein insertase